MAGSLDDLQTEPPPSVARPTRSPLLVSIAIALAAGSWRFQQAGEFPTGAALTSLTVVCGFFLGRRIGGAWAGLLMAMVLAVTMAAFAMSFFPPGAIFLAVTTIWWALRFNDNPAPANMLVALMALAALGWLVTYGPAGY